MDVTRWIEIALEDMYQHIILGCWPHKIEIYFIWYISFCNVNDIQKIAKKKKIGCEGSQDPP